MKSDYVLIVDDDQDAREILSVFVRSMKYAYKTASEGASALKQIQSDVPSLILLDLMMPVMDGFAVLTRLRSDPRTRHIPVIVVTACSQDQINMLKLPGVKDVVQKGKLATLRNLIPQYLQTELKPPEPLPVKDKPASIIHMN
ncbi:MAG: response regulator [Anaerolineae bacterium]|nr:response regulator [Anaerolineae bacterium]